MKIYQAISQKLQAIENCIKSNNEEWEEKHRQAIEAIMKNTAPSGSGFDNGTILDEDNSTDNKLVFITSFHHMDENGYYDGWTQHSVIVTPSLVFGFDIRVTGKNKNDIKEYIGDVFAEWLNEEYQS